MYISTNPQGVQRVRLLCHNLDVQITIALFLYCVECVSKNVSISFNQQNISGKMDKKNRSLKTEGDFCRQGRDTVIAPKHEKIYTGSHAHSLESS
jgi:hypothetical protein